jgi:xylose isomerase
MAKLRPGYFGPTPRGSVRTLLSSTVSGTILRLGRTTRRCWLAIARVTCDCHRVGAGAIIVMKTRLRTSLGIWAFGPMVTRFVPGGYQPAHSYESEPVAEKVHRAVSGLGELIDGYEFHYPDELSAENLDDVRAALGEHDIYCVASGLHLDPRFGRGGLVNPDPALRASARSRLREAAQLAGELGARLVVWPGGEGYNYPFQAPYADSWRWLIEGLAEAARTCAQHGTTLLLEHKNSEPAMKVLMRNVGMTLHVIHKLRAQGIDNVAVNLDWQHLIMNGEHLPEYAALLASEGLLGHLHANSGWGTFDDDNMVGATAFMETLELALELRRCGYGSRGERLGFDLYPYTEDQVAAVRRSVEQWRFIDSVAARIDEPALRAAQQAKDAVSAYELVYAALGA